MVIHGYIKGLVGELFSWAALVLSGWAAILFYPAGAVFIRNNFMQNVRAVPEILAFIAIFLIITFFVKMLGGVLKSVIEGVRLGFVNKIFGAIFGMVEGFAFTLLILFVIKVQPLFNSSKLIGESFFADLLLPIIKLPQNREQGIIITVLFVLTGGKIV
jgi:membrane protein required for colicin V production